MTVVGEGAEADAAAAAMEVEAYKRLYPLQFYERYLDQNVRPDGRPLTRARPTSVNLGNWAFSTNFVVNGVELVVFLKFQSIS